jgi:hypothetical protein
MQLLNTIAFKTLFWGMGWETGYCYAVQSGLKLGHILQMMEERHKEDKELVHFPWLFLLSK